MLCDNGGCEKCTINGFGVPKGNLRLDHNDFRLQLRHIKCKIAHLAREQMKKKTVGPNNHTTEYVYQPRNMTYSSTLEDMSHGTSNFDSKISDENSLAFDDQRSGLHSTLTNSNDSVHDVNPTSSIQKTANDTSLDSNQRQVIPKNLRSSPSYGNHVPGSRFFSYWITYISQYFNKRMRVLLVAVMIGILIWMALVYGAIIGASLCNSGQYPSFQFSTSRSRVSLSAAGLSYSDMFVNMENALINR
ncbi:hypothetical protein PV327_000081 [Microctonus hyperodae]|uniref:Uncharacterized protein n=1 Tax=Microctonus hyperodae TaxID=165561 RepID=A0AA39G5H7_MICHY|nr:hypothetical protein PV327_000081 [Microctonus hyperodae]